MPSTRTNQPSGTRNTINKRRSRKNCMSMAAAAAAATSTTNSPLLSWCNSNDRANDGDFHRRSPPSSHSRHEELIDEVDSDEVVEINERNDIVMDYAEDSVQVEDASPPNHPTDDGIIIEDDDDNTNDTNETQTLPEVTGESFVIPVIDNRRSDDDDRSFNGVHWSFQQNYNNDVISLIRIKKTRMAELGSETRRSVERFLKPFEMTELPPKHTPALTLLPTNLDGTVASQTNGFLETNTFSKGFNNVQEMYHLGHHIRKQSELILRAKERLYKLSQFMAAIESDIKTTENIITSNGQELRNDLIQYHNMEMIFRSLQSTQASKTKKRTAATATTTTTTTSSSTMTDEPSNIRNVIDKDEIPNPYEPVYRTEFTCPICCEPMTGSSLVFSNNCSHVICLDCSTKLQGNECAFCRRPLTSMYNIELINSKYVASLIPMSSTSSNNTRRSRR